MSEELVFYTHPMSRGRIVRWMLEELGQPYSTEILEHGTMKAPEYLAINPMGKVPAIRHGEAVVTECGAICAYLADAFPDAGLAPLPGDPKRGAYLRWLFFGAGPVEAAVTNKSLGFEIPADKQRSVGYGCWDHVNAALDALVSANTYVTGERFTAADVYLGSEIGWGLMFGTLEKRPALESYWERISSRPAAVRAREIDDALLPKES